MSTAGDRYPAWLGAPRRAGPTPRARTHLGDARTGKLRTALGQNERQDVEGHGDGEGVSNEMRRSKTKER